MASNEDFSVEDAEALLELIYAKPSGRIVIVGGQAVNFWADRYVADQTQLLVHRPFSSRDLDLLGSIANAYRLAAETHATLQKPRRGLASPVVANVQIETGAVIRSVQFLKSLRGVTNREIDLNAVPFALRGVEILVADPITMLKAKLRNLADLDQRGRNDLKHVEMLRSCVPAFLQRELTAADETDAAARHCLRTLQRILELSSLPLARTAPVDWPKLIPIEHLQKVKNQRLRNFSQRQFQRWLDRISG